MNSFKPSAQPHWNPAPVGVPRVPFENPTPIPPLPAVETDLATLLIGPELLLEAQLLNGIVGPRPIGWISTVSTSGILNLAPYSFFTGFCYSPGIVGFSSAAYKDSVSNAEQTGEFVWNLVTRPLAEAMNASGARVDPGTSEFELAGLTPVASTRVRPPRVGQSPVAFECKVTDIVRLRNSQGEATESWVTFGEVVAVHVANRLLEDGVYQTEAAHPVLRAGGAGVYFELGEKFVMAPPK